MASKASTTFATLWSVGMVHVAGPVPYTLLLTYGFRHTLSPEAEREGMAHGASR